MTKTEALERVRRAVESRCNQHGHIDDQDLRDVLSDVIDDLAPERQGEQTQPDQEEQQS